MRITRAHVEAKVDIVNHLLGFDPETVEYLTVGAVRLDSAYDGWAVHQVCNDAGGARDLSQFGYSTLRENANFLSGMIATLRLDNVKVEG